MKTLISFQVVFLVIVTLHVNATWIPFGPDSIVANKICFLLDNSNHWGICHDEGLYLYDHVTHLWTDYPSDLPVVDAAYLNGQDILVIMGCGTFSDGIYSFNPSTGEYTVIEYLVYPNFLAIDEITQLYYAGHYHGLMTSYDGIGWTAVSTFNDMNIVAIDILQNHIVVSRMDNINAIWHSDDYGMIWTQSPAGTPMISCLAFDYNQKIYGIFPDESYSSGLWSSADYGNTWEVEFWSLNMSCVGIDVLGNVFTGWDENPTGEDEGIAHYDTVNGILSFINEGLSSLIINDICVNPWMSAIALFCCTENGAHVTYGYLSSRTKQGQPGYASMKIFPNPFSTSTSIEYTLKNPGKVVLAVFNHLGQQIETLVNHPQQKGKHQVTWNAEGQPAGIYFYRLQAGEQQATGKMVVIR